MQPHKLTAINDLDLIPGICGKIWETDGTTENTQESYLNTYRGTWGNLWKKKDNIWYGFRYVETGTGNDISFEKYDGTFHNRQVLPFSVVRDEEIGTGQVTDMTFFDDIQYFIFSNELWRTTPSASGDYRLKIFDNMLGRYLKFIKTLDAIYVYDSASVYATNVTNNLWKIENGDQLVLVQTFNNDDSIFLGSYKDKLYSSRKDSSGNYIVYATTYFGHETALSPSFTGKPRLSTTNGALYISDAHPDDRNVTKYYWKLDEISNSFEQVTENYIAFVGSVSSSYKDISLVSGNQFVLHSHRAFTNPPKGSLYKILDSGEKELIEEGRTVNSHYLNGKMYIKLPNEYSNRYRSIYR
ncbi:hypothetical protein GQR58_020382 [Nymphon striatum]|nr:hypothetical protein GQR58_020382 [Nymphon striatum]